MSILDTLRIKPRAFGWADYPAGASFGPRELADYEFVWMVSGDVRWRLGGETLRAPAGTLLLARPGMTDAFIWDPRRRTHHGYVHFDIEDPNHALPLEEHWPLLLTPDEASAIRPLLSYVVSALTDPQRTPRDLVEHTLRQALVMFANRAPGNTEQALLGEHATVTATLGFLKRAWSGSKLMPVHVPELAKKAHVSEGHLSRTLKAELGVTPHQLTLLLRLARAASLLSRTNLSVADVAEQCGFESPFHFSRCFRQAQGASPREFRRQALAGTTPPLIHPPNVERFARWLFSS